ncbi:ead/Ea22-like family protein [Klebsiella aerogenes]|uniref:ead/Ea22-like family protein n=1 Tax=Klebsiella aerogenes TaxID=548 RepID=UPI0021D1793D|nr:ead/Ea22-like family protein [Klebsiella aerogenes]MCU6424270.1 ead/Ea22-like family protein [Klebsiella aerogenes]
MTDITELAQSLKAAAEKATPGRIGDRIDGSGSIKYQCFGNDGSLVLQTDHKNMEYGFIGPNSNADELFFRMCSPENILALVEALETGNTENERMAREIISRNGEIEGLRRHITELESRTVTVKQGEVLVTVAGFTGCGKSAIAGEIEIAMKAIGVPVTWANGDTEKRMTGADWLTAIEMYKPTVRIVEVNITRAAGHQVGG